MPNVYVFVGTANGLFRIASDARRREWSAINSALSHFEITSIHADETTGRLLAATRDSVDGARIHFSDDNGETWRQIPAGPRFPAGGGFMVRQIWEIAGGAQPGALLAGVEDAGLFRSEDLGETWQEVSGLRAYFAARPQAAPTSGSLVHSVVVDPNESRRLWLATSTAGVLRSTDGGATWIDANQGTQTAIAHGASRTHKMILSPTDRQTLYLQHFEGVYQSTKNGEPWRRIGADLPTTFGFPIVQTTEGDLFVAPLVSFAKRFMPDGRPRLYRSRDGGETWAPVDRGLPAQPSFGGVLRDALAADSLQPAGIYFGTTSGEIYASPDRGETWLSLPGSYPRVTAIASVVVAHSP